MKPPIEMHLDDLDRGSSRLRGDHPDRTAPNYQRISCFVGVFSICVGLLVLLGWASKIALLTSLVPRSSAMRPPAALGLALAGLGLCLDYFYQAGRIRWFIPRLSSGLAALIGAATLIELGTGTHYTDRILFPHFLTALAPGNVPALTALSFVLFGVACILSMRRTWFAIGQYLAIATGLVSIANVIAYMFGTRTVLEVALPSENGAMAIHTSLTLLLLSVGCLLSRPDWGVIAAITANTSAGAMGRRLMPAALLLPTVIGWLRWQGQVHGWYDAAFGQAMSSSTNVIVLGVLIWRGSHNLQQLDLARSRAEELVRESEQQLRRILEAAPDAMVLADAEGRIVLVNARAETLFGYRREELLGQTMQVLLPDLTLKGSAMLMDAITEIPGIRKNGAPFPAEITFSLIQTSRGPCVCHAIRDITARKTAEESLRESEDRYRVVVDSLSEAVWTCLPDGQCDFLSRQWIKYTGIPEADQLGVSWVEQVHPDDRAAVLEGWRHSLVTGQQFAAEYRLRDAQGQYARFHGVATPIRNAAGEITKWFGTSTDIEKLRLASAALRVSEAGFRQLADAMPHMVWTAKADGLVEYWSQGWYDYTGMTFEAARDSGWQLAIHPDDLREYMQRWARSKHTGESFEAEYRVKRGSDQAYRWYLGRALSVLDDDGQVIRWLGTCTDMHDQKEAAALIRTLNEELDKGIRSRTAELAKSNSELAQAKAHVQAVLDAATQVSIIAADTEGIIQVFNSGAERMLRFQAHEVEGLCTPQVFHDLEQLQARASDLSTELGEPITGQDFFMACARAGRADEGEWTYIRKDGSRLDVSMSITAVRNSHGTIEGFLCIASDITIRKSLERESHINNGKLIKQTQRAQDANQAKSHFLAEMSHEIRTPMNAILGMADVLWDSDLNDDQRRYVEVFRRAGSNLIVLINNILDLSKIESGHLELESVTFDLEDVADQAIELIAPRSRASGIRLLLHLIPGFRTGRIGDPTRLRQILINLLGNAVKFTNAGQVVLAIEDDPSGNDGEVRFSVTDTGVGIPPGKLKTIFDDFTQADASTTRIFGGTGLGLGISRRLVEEMGGRLTVTSTLGEGSNFCFTVKLEIGPERLHKLDGVIEDIRGRRVLVIDDNATNCLILEESLNSWGFESDSYTSPQRALVALPNEMSGPCPYSLAIVDRCMAGMDGFETAAGIHRIAAGLPVIMLTYGAKPGDAALRKTAHLAGWHLKPVKRCDLQRLVCSAMKPTVEADMKQQGQVVRSEAEIVSPFRILVTEDSPDNRLIVQAYLHNRSYSLTFAEDGKSGVDRFSSSSFDLILMDIQMPVMDGLTATRLIRAIEQERGLAPIPIIALTANARLQDAELSRAAGCTDHLSKPISKQRLLSVIEEHRRRLKQTKQPQPRPMERAFIEVPLGLEEIVPPYLAARIKDVPIISGLLEEAKFEQIAMLGHNMKGTGTSFGFPELSRMGTALEDFAGQSNREALASQLLELGRYLESVELSVGTG